MVDACAGHQSTGVSIASAGNVKNGRQNETAQDAVGVFVGAHSGLITGIAQVVGVRGEP